MGKPISSFFIVQFENDLYKVSGSCMSAVYLCGMKILQWFSLHFRGKLSFRIIRKQQNLGVEEK